ncbi:MAG: methionine synthase, partial [Gammaproteobacteria bacterium]|nr:methionine synthase [candidate division Zixibacteria bacterium]NIR92442.1 methionine synthase [Gammaproteobacteria bacterium]NIS45772.1 methionine synthase [candidate division Zixibacteria bacterium]NIU13894.1 methionine synthase [candidate division Zixibacteria bacterium]NIV05946.1 methionine synthase [candidate division Zixibacteria bacterium]
RAYIQAGARIVLSNTFGGNVFRLDGHGVASRLEELVIAGAHNLRLEVDAVPHQVLAAGSIGPTGEILEP